MNKIIKGYRNIFGEKHQTICEGLKCQCHKEVEAFILKSLKTQREEIIKEIEGMKKEVKKQKYLHYGEAHIRRFKQGYNTALKDLKNKIKL